MKSLRSYSLIVLLMIMPVSSICAESFVIFTEEFPPFNFSENGRITGVSTEVVEAVMKRTGFDYEIKSYPWVRAYGVSQKRPNSLIFSISRQTKRENLFKWIEVIVPSVHSVFALKKRSDIQAITFEDLKKYRIGTTIEDARETYLLDKGFEIDKLHRIGGGSSNLRNYMKLKMERIDLWPMPDAVMDYIVRQTGDDPDKTLRKVFKLSEISQDGYYLAASLQTSDEVVEKIKKTLIEFKKTQEYAMILDRWGI